jgi:outer membrane protein insertion porin family
MVEKIKKGSIKHCVTALLCIFFSSIIYTQESENSFDFTSKYDAPEQIYEADTNQEDDALAQTPLQPATQTSRRISNIIVSGNKFSSSNAILNLVPYKIGEIFDQRKTRSLIHNLYYGLKKFRTIKVFGEPINDHFIALHILVEEKTPLAEIKTSGNHHVTDKEIAKKINLDEITAIDVEELKIIANKIKEIYIEKGYNQTDIETEFTIDEDNRATASFIIHEGAAATVKQVRFIGNNHISSKELRTIALTKEDWLLSFLDKSGNYNPDRLEGDKHFIEQHYQNHGFLHAKIINTIVDINPKNQHIILTFEIEEGDRYIIDKITVPGNDLVSQDYLLSRLPIHTGMYYSRDAIANSIKRLEVLWGDYGYIFAHVEPSIQPNEDDKTVAISFFSELGDQVHLNKITIRGNKKTRDKIIRRKILLEEGELLTQTRMNLSKRNVASLGYFDPRDGVNWKIRRLNKETADLDLIVKETRTGHFGAQLGFGGAGADLGSPLSSVSLKGELSDTNLFGSGVNINLSTTYSKDEQTAMLHVAQPWMFDKPILGAFDIYHRRPVYDELQHVKTIHQKLTGGCLTAGFITQSQKPIMHDVNVLISAGAEDIKYTARPIALFDTALERVEFQGILDKEFAPGTFAYISTKLEQDTRNHPVHTLYGHRWRIANRFAIPTLNNNIGFYKLEFEASWFTPLIAEYDLILKLHGYFGIAAPFKNRTVPFGELFHIGGQNSVRGFLFGQIGPQFAGDTIGGTKAFFWNAELIVPITNDMNMKAVAFYDGGTGFDNPYLNNVSKAFVTGNNFDYRHAVGIGLRLLQPMPINIDWGFKIDPRKNKRNPKLNETASEVHFGMSYDW